MAKLVINGVLGPWPWGDISSGDVMAALDEIPAEEPLDVEWHSPGGYVSEGKSIYHALSQHEGDLTSHVILAGSAASWGAMAADKVVVYDYSEFFLHNSQINVYAQVNRQKISELLAEIEKTGENMAKLDVSLAQIYADRAGMEIGNVRKLMEDETTFYGKEILTAGFASDLIETQKRPENLDSWDLKELGYKNYQRSQFHKAREHKFPDKGVTWTSNDGDSESTIDLEVEREILASVLVVNS